MTAKGKKEEKKKYILLSDAIRTLGESHGVVGNYAEAIAKIYLENKVIAHFEKKGDIIFILE